ncbi:hypothetical protein [Yoonia sp. SDW83-1]|uniref:hypothetical protein n=1 Tax=Yoonia sp. SDW83-1 TaxID=3366945 RepID=UPI00398C2F64
MGEVVAPLNGAAKQRSVGCATVVISKFAESWLISCFCGVWAGRHCVGKASDPKAGFGGINDARGLSVNAVLTI